MDDLHLLPRGDGCKYELVDGALWVEPPPPPEHARVVKNLTAALAGAAAGTDLHVGAWRPSPSPALVDVVPYLDEDTSWVAVGEPEAEGWSVEHLESVPPSVCLELVEGSIHLLPEPSPEHQAVVRVLSSLLTFKRAQVQVDVLLDRRTRLRPDVLVPGIESTPPILVIEVAEHATSLVDRVLRPALWADVALPHFWRFDLEKQVLCTYELDGQTFRQTHRFDDEVVIDEPVPLRFRIADLVV